MRMPQLSVAKFTLMVSAIGLSSILFIVLILLDGTNTTPPDQVKIAQLDVTMFIPPPPPPPQITTTSDTSHDTSTLNVLDLTGTVKVNYGIKNNMAMPNITDISMPKFSLKRFELRDFYTSKIPMLEVEKLDKVPKVVSQRYVRPPKSVRKYGEKRIKTTVELIIDQSGKPFIKKIIDPAFPEMIETIKTWVKYARFEVPKKEGKAVQAVYLYDINFNYG
ncbi:hypothetical protein [Pseudoalteromonas luteoviolacea]|uniref:TonB C-terminal domain-containing protein n=1 Tax=Pseudoalteromonas luteoviolacea S4054 TaxID=1129367 RepID=A0A0F6AF83_9GAMM|nr:hypothetical protein [Pseudoalteromonas luteoviolacea]AOT07985.1 hypothetical protein S4054249_09070 [Pseudoalteromonas luteoviolacea]AOT12901.1 hypothetical protein S40542_09070 [Pseudoalteromonas luteoviolacea]AOT17814.1 hypothetical protein S4054_09065 [Pseudoalteromonas luteoviolacea]KKE84466.1 hypothetical protein N479_09500 [Pseudoalteromonas luteoviolacea S4054]KZN71841.1 hypothetical protein N481_18040 [Pseudoalteromonas luteoviolacea S4047-1]